MKKFSLRFRCAIYAALFVLWMTAASFAADIDGKWTASFDTQVGTQNYTYTFKADGEKLTGTAKNNWGENPVEDGTIKGNDIAFTENIDFQGQKITIKYTGKLDGDQITFTREVGNFATENFVAKREKTGN